MSDPDYVSVRRPADSPFGVLAGDLVAGEPLGYDLSLVRSMTDDGLIEPLVVKALRGGRFKVVDGLKRLAAVRQLVRSGRVVYDPMRRLMRPAGRVFSLLQCRVQSPSVPERPSGDKAPGESAGLSTAQGPGSGGS